ncbi:GPP34 family phosphoprotein [Streptomyces sp. NPDC002018]|uniref:GOLPH3/VPS74 family protein n=1 Tax=Streptomyces sp. NPDC002018 TaxID=3364629 RepID=UPI00368849B3
MTTPRDLFLVSMDAPSDSPVDQGDLSLALAGAEVIDLLNAGAVTLEGGRLVPGDPPATTDRLLDEAASSLVRQTPYETVADWLWRRGRGLAAAYLADLEAAGQITRQRYRRWLVFRSSRPVPADSPARELAANRLASDEPVLAALVAAVGINGGRAEDPPDVAVDPAGTPAEDGAMAVRAGDDDAVEAVLTEVDDAVGELVAERRRRVRRREEAAETNRRRGY